MEHVAHLVNLGVPQCQYGLDSPGLDTPRAGSCEHTYEPSGSIKCTEELA